MEVYRLLPQWNESLLEYESLEAELVQMIYFPVLTDNNSLGRCNCVIDSSKERMYTYSYNVANPYNSASPDGRLCRISSFKIPDYRKQDVYLEDRDILDSFSANYDATNSQGGVILNGKLFVAQGYASFGIYLNIFDLEKMKQLSRIDLLASGITWEPEGCFVYNDNLMISTGENIWEFHFE